MFHKNYCDHLRFDSWNHYTSSGPYFNKQDMEKKITMILILDSNELLMKSIFIWRKSKTIPFEYFYLLQLIKYLKLFQSNKVFLAADKEDSWRKVIFSSYKENRKKLRDSYPDIPWEKLFYRYDNLLQNINNFTSITAIQIPHLEGDDIITSICYIYKDAQKIVVSQDRDIAQLAKLPLTKVYSTRTKKFREAEPLEVVYDKILKGDRSDNIPRANDLVEKIRNCILVDLLNIPRVIIDEVRKYVDTINKNKQINNKFLNIYKYKFLQKSKHLLGI